MEFQEQKAREDPREPKGKKGIKAFLGLLRYPSFWGTKGTQASKDFQESQVRKETEAFLGYQV